MHFSKILQIFGGLVLGCIKTKFCKKTCVRQHFSSSTRFAYFCTAPISKFSHCIGCVGGVLNISYPNCEPIYLYPKSTKRYQTSGYHRDPGVHDAEAHHHSDGVVVDIQIRPTRKDAFLRLLLPQDRRRVVGNVLDTGAGDSCGNQVSPKGAYSFKRFSTNLHDCYKGDPVSW